LPSRPPALTLRHQKPLTALLVVMVTILASSAVDHGFEPKSGQTKDYKIE
jgi:hypothetical protein